MRVVNLWGPWSPFLSLAAKVRGMYRQTAESTDPFSLPAQRSGT